MNWIINFENGKSPCRVNQAATTVGSFIYSFGGYCQQQTVSELKCYSPIDVLLLNYFLKLLLIFFNINLNRFMF